MSTVNISPVKKKKKNVNNLNKIKTNNNIVKQQFNMEDLYEERVIGTRISKKDGEEEIPFFLLLNPKSILDDPIRPCIDVDYNKGAAEVGPVDTRHSLDYLNPVHSPTFKNYDVPNEDEWKLRRKKYDPGPGSTVPNYAYYEKTKGGDFSRNHEEKDLNMTSNNDVSTAHIGPGFYKTTLGKFSQVACTTGGSFSKLPNINSTEAAYRKGLLTGGPSFFAPKRDDRSQVNYNATPTLLRTANTSLTPGPTTYNPNTCGSFGTKGGFKMREETQMTKQVRKMKRLLDDPKDYFIELANDESYIVNKKYPKPTKLTIIQNALEKCNKQILHIIDGAREEELKRQKLQHIQKRKLYAQENYDAFMSQQFQNYELEQKYDANRKVTECEIKHLLIKQKQLKVSYEKLLKKDQGLHPEKYKVIDINNKESSYSNDLNRWLNDMKIRPSSSQSNERGDEDDNNDEENDRKNDGIGNNTMMMEEKDYKNEEIQEEDSPLKNEYYNNMKKVFQNHGAIIWPTLSPVRYNPNDNEKK